ncbi:hypothetical protein D3C73_1169440 [compost metagenome]
MKRAAYFKRNGSLTAGFLDTLHDCVDTRLGAGNNNLPRAVHIGQLNLAAFSGNAAA